MSGETRDVEALRKLILEHFNPTPHGFRLRPADAAEAILASDWLAEHDAEVEARVRDEIAQAIEAGPWGPGMPNGMHREAITACTRIARGGVR